MEIKNLKKVSLVLIFFIVSLISVSNAENDLTKQYNVIYSSSRVDDMNPFQVIPGKDGKIEIIAGITDGGCINGETLIVKSVNISAKENITEINLLYTVTGESCKALFLKELKASMQINTPGKYRIKLWMKETFSNSKEQLTGSKDIIVLK